MYYFFEAECLSVVFLQCKSLFFIIVWCFFPTSKAESAISKIPAAFRGSPAAMRPVMPMQFPSMSASGSFAGAGPSFLSPAMLFGYVLVFFPNFGGVFSKKKYKPGMKENDIRNIIFFNLRLNMVAALGQELTMSVTVRPPSLPAGSVPMHQPFPRMNVGLPLGPQVPLGIVLRIFLYLRKMRMMIQIIWIRCEGVKMYVIIFIGNVFFMKMNPFSIHGEFFHDTPDV